MALDGGRQAIIRSFFVFQKSIPFGILSRVHVKKNDIITNNGDLSDRKKINVVLFKLAIHNYIFSV